MTTVFCSRDTEKTIVLGVLLVLAAGIAACSDDEGPGASAESSRERAFLSAMVPHHKSAVEMARSARSRGAHPEIRSLADEIVSTQELEIRRMKEIHRRLFGERLVANDGAHADLGLSAAAAGMDHGDEAALEKARPFDRAFIDAMIPHHAGAIRMARAVMAGNPDDEVVDLADGIIQAQSQEIGQLNQWRLEWYGSESSAGGVPKRGERGSGDEHEGHGALPPPRDRERPDTRPRASEVNPAKDFERLGDRPCPQANKGVRAEAPRRDRVSCARAIR